MVLCTPSQKCYAAGCVFDWSACTCLQGCNALPENQTLKLLDAFPANRTYATYSCAHACSPTGTSILLFSMVLLLFGPGGACMSAVIEMQGKCKRR